MAYQGKSLQARLAKLEDAADKQQLPNGGLMFVVVGDEETNEAALNRTLEVPAYSRLSATRRRKLVPVYCTERDAACL